jgi:uncharacterized protein
LTARTIKTTNWKKPVPDIDEDHRPFWDALKEHKFMLYRCKKCGAWYWPVSFCINHSNEPFFGNMEWAQASGKGKVFAFNIHWVAFDSRFKDAIPYVYSLLELDEGPIFGSNVIDCDPSKVTIGMPVEIVFEDAETPDGIKFTMPKFAPVSK